MSPIIRESTRLLTGLSCVLATSLILGCAASAPAPASAPPQHQLDPVEVRLTQQLEDQALDLMQPFANQPPGVVWTTAGARSVAADLDARVASGVPDAAESAGLKPVFLKMAAARDTGQFAVAAVGLCYPDNKSVEAETVGRTVLQIAAMENKFVPNVRELRCQNLCSAPNLRLNPDEQLRCRKACSQLMDDKLDPDGAALLSDAKKEQACGEVLVNVRTFCAQVGSYREAMSERELDKSAQEEAFWTAAAAANEAPPRQAPAVVVVNPPPIYESPTSVAPAAPRSWQPMTSPFQPSPPVQVPSSPLLQ